MFVFDPLGIIFAGYFELAQGFSLANASACKAETKPKIVVTAATKDIRYDFSKSKKDLADQKIDTVSPYSHSQSVYIGGLMNGQIEMKSNVKLAWSTQTVTRQSCFWYEEVNIHMEIDPTILVAREFPRDSCEYKEILNHENKHIVVDRFIVKKYRKLMEDYLTQLMQQAQAYGPVHANKTPVVRKEMTAYIEAAVNKVSDAMHTERRQRQQAVDSREEYDRVSAACKK
ncbi:MAG: hypothetical protein CMH30_08165 [Micavibrio sp.]|nr:hypothetical protein [Micavibrio sp.]